MLTRALLLLGVASWLGCPAPGPRRGTTTPPPLAQPTVQIVKGRGKDPAPMALVPAGSFLRGAAAGAPGEDDERPQRLVHLDAFAIDQHAITVRQYRACVEAKACSVPDAEKLCTYSMEGRDEHPVNCVSWEQARLYCEWASERLPSEAEWEKAARGVDGRLYPWGNRAADCTLANFALGNERYCRSQTVPVTDHAASASPYGAVQMAGNVFSWVADLHDREYYAVAPERNPSGPVVGKHRVVRGGSWFSQAVDLRVTMRGLIPPEVRLNYVGFRCAQSM